MDEFKFGLDEGLATREKPEVRSPHLYKVFLINDDYTTMDFVIYILEKIFHKSPVEAAQIMLHVHNYGEGLAGVYPHGIAETKVAAADELAQKSGFPLKCKMERE